MAAPTLTNAGNNLNDLTVLFYRTFLTGLNADGTTFTAPTATGTTGTGTGLLPNGATPINVASANAAAANNQTLTGAAGKFTWLTGFQITGLGATSGSTITVTTTGLTNNLTYYMPIPTGATVNVTPLNVVFSSPIPSSAVNTNIVLNVPSFGAGNTNAAVNAQGYLL